MKKNLLHLTLTLLTLIGSGLTKIATAQYCQPTYTQGSQFGIYITKVELDSISDSTGAMASPFYSFDSTKHTTLTRNMNYTVNVVGGTFNGNGASVAVFIDWNSDQDFADAGERVGTINPIGASPTKYSVTFTVPCGASLGNTRIRVRMAAQNGGIATMDPCNNYGWGECQDYRLTIADNPLKVSYLGASQPNTLNIVKGKNNQEILCLKVFTEGCQDTLSLTDFFLSNAGSTDTADISLNEVYFTGTSNQFATSNLFGSNSAKDIFQVSGTQLLSRDTNYFWLAYDVPSGATTGNFLDGTIDSIAVRGQIFTTANGNPSGSRMIDSAMTLQSISMFQEDTTPVNRGSYANMIMKVQIDMSSAGGSIPLNALTFKTSGSTNPAVDITRARVFYTGANNYFDSTVMFGSSLSPNGTFTVNGTTYLAPGTNYFWLAYDISAVANIDDTLDAQLTSADIDGNSTFKIGATAGYRTILGSYCFPVHPGCGTSFIQGFTFSQIANTSSGCVNFSGNAYSNYPASYFTTNVNKGNTYRAIAKNSNAIQTFSVWIDFNHNGAFDNTEYFQLTKNAQANIASNDTGFASIQIPCTAKTGWTNMRIRSRGQGGANGATDACTQFGSGETEDYTIFITNQPISYVDAAAASNADVLKGWTNQQIIKIPVVANNCGGNNALTKLNFNTNGTTDTLDIANAKVYYTGNSRTFATTTLLGTANTPGTNFSITCNQTLAIDTNWIWLTYDVAANATKGNYLDAELISMVISGNTYNPNNQAPSGNRLINDYMTVSSVNAIHPTTALVYTGTTGQQILRMNVLMSSGAASAISRLYLNTKGTNNPTTTISNAILYSTGSDATFTNPVQYGATTAAPNGAIQFNGNLNLNPGNNYFWLTYDIQANAVANDTVDAQIDSIIVNGTTTVVSNGAPAGYRLVAKTYCTPQHTQSCAQNPTYIHGVKLNTLNNLKSGCTSITGNKYNVYTTAQYTTTLYRGYSYYLKVWNDTNSQAQQFGFWIDLNQNGTFETTEFVLINSNLAINSVDSALLTIPCSTPKGQTRIRVRTRALGGQFTNADACTAFGSGETEDYTITIGDNPETGWLGIDKYSCNGGNVSLSPGAGYVQYLWSTGDTTATVQVNVPGKVWVTAKNSSGCFGTDTVNIIASNVSLNLGSDTAVCNGGSVDVTAPAGYNTYTWSNGDTTATTNIKTAGDYICTVTNNVGCAVSDTISLIWKYATVNLGNDTSICIGKSLSLNSGTHSNYLWNTGDTISTIQVNIAGTYYVSVNDIGGCTGYDTITVGVSNPAVNLGNDVSVCAGTQVMLDAGIWNDITWNNGAKTQTIYATSSQDYFVNVKDQFGCPASDTVNVTFNALPLVNLGNDTTVCAGLGFSLDGGAGTSWTWNTGDTIRILPVLAAGTYGVVTKNAAGCTASDSVKIAISSATVSAGPDKTFCEGKSDTLFASNGFPSYQWSNGATSWFIVPSTSGKYWVKVTNLYGCTAIDTANVNVLPLTKATFTYKINAGQVSFTADDTTGQSYLWDFGDGNLSTRKSPTITYGSFGTYKVTLKVVAANGCEDNSSQTILFNGLNSISGFAENMSALPNPFDHNLQLNLELTVAETLNITIMDVSGKIVWNRVESFNSGKVSYGIDLSNLSNGVYFIKVGNEKHQGTLKVVKTGN